MGYSRFQRRAVFPADERVRCCDRLAVRGAGAADRHRVFLEGTLPLQSDILWGLAAGISGGIGLAALYRALAMGKMGIAAPFVAVLGGGIPAIVGILLEGTPKTAQLLGFAVAMLAVWLIARPGGGGDARAGLGMAILAGTFIGLFLICLDRIEGGGIFWSLAVARLSSMLLMTLVALFARQRIMPDGGALP